MSVIEQAGTVITEPGIYTIPEDEYHADPIPAGSLSHSGARLLLDCPAKFDYWRHREQHKATFDFGKAAHTLILGAGATLHVIDAEDWRTKDAKAARDDARALGHTPLLRHEMDVVEAMAAAIKAHPIAVALLADGTPEQSMFWQTNGIWRRARIDWTPANTRRPILVDYKTTISAEPGAFSRSVASYGYHQQADWYLDGWRTLTGEDAAFVFIAQEKEAPYLVNVFELDAVALDIGRARNLAALDLYRQCTETGVWPGYSDAVEQIGLPRWAVIEHENTTIEDQGASW